jgi:hypothetical protein
MRVRAGSTIVTALACALGAMLAVVPGGAALAARPAPCGPRSVAVLGDGYGRLVRTGPPSGLTYTLCRAGKRPLKVSEFDRDAGGGGRSFRMAGRYLAWDFILCDKEHCGGYVDLLDMASGKPTAIYGPGLGYNGNISPARGLVVTARGSIAWMRVPATAVGVSVYLRPAGGVATVVDAGPSVDDSSLGVAADRVYSVSGGQPRSVVVP